MAKGGELGWAAIGIFVAGFDILAPETLTAAFKRAPLPVRLGALAITSAHLLDLIPHSVDPFYLLQDLLPPRESQPMVIGSDPTPID